MADGTITDLDTFRRETRAWLEENCPPSMRTPLPLDEIVEGGRNGTFKNPESKLWLERMAAKGWTAPQWPKAYGGGGLSKDESIILAEELKRIKAREVLRSFGLMMLGPVLLEYGTEDQKARFLPDIAAGKTRWCQGYSEPGAGSDLAGLATKCEDKGDYWLINGQKVWTSYANKADWIFCLVRTDTSVKHEGISFVLFDMTSKGVDARPIQLISGASPFCETFFDNVEVPKDQMVGRLNGGWEIAKRLLQFERSNISTMEGGFGAIDGTDKIYSLADSAKDYVGVTAEGKLEDGDLRARITDHLMAEDAFNLTIKRMKEQSGAGEEVGHTASILKFAGATLNKNDTELKVEVMGSQGIGWSGDTYTERETYAPRAMLRAKANSIEGGTSEVNLNVIAKRVLGLREHQ